MINTSNGRLYGTTLYGGKYDKGTVFYYDPSTAEFKKFIRSPVVVQMEATLMKMFWNYFVLHQAQIA